MSRTLFVVQENDWYEYQGLHGVFSTAELASKYISEQADSDNFYVEIEILDEPDNE